MKFSDVVIQEQIRRANGPREAARIGRDRSLPLRKDWDSVKDGVMYEAIRAKFSQNEDIRKELLNTGDAELIEDSPIDFYWGWGSDRSGKNRLGKLLMKLRTELKEVK